MRRIIQIISVLFLAVMVGAVLVIKNLDINSYREQIQKLVADKTDHQLLLNGELKLSLFPIAIYAQDVAILQTSQAKQKHTHNYSRGTNVAAVAAITAWPVQILIR